MNQTNRRVFRCRAEPKPCDVEWLSTGTLSDCWMCHTPSRPRGWSSDRTGPNPNDVSIVTHRDG